MRPQIDPDHYHSRPIDGAAASDVEETIRQRRVAIYHRTMMAKAAPIDQHLAQTTPDQRRALSRLRDTLHSIVPDLEECISYGMPAFRFEGRVVAGFMATAKGCSYYPFSGSTHATLASDIERYSHTKSALHFDPNRGLPASLVRKLLRTRIAEIPKQKSLRKDASSADQKRKRAPARAMRK